jgi:hypothetical protein
MRLANMPRKKLEVEPSSSPLSQDLAEKLSQELKSNRESGQPLVYERELRANRFSVTVIWDEWDHIPLEERAAIILRAYELAEDASYPEKIALATGLTVPEATAAGMLPYQVGTALRKADPVTFEQCWKAMLEEGASQLFGPNVLQLRFATRVEAEACRRRLVKRLPGSDDVWVISREIAIQDSITLEDSVEIGRT